MITVVVPTADQATGVGGTLLIPVPCL